MRLSRVALACALAACGGSGDDGGDFTSIEVEPATVTLTVPLGGTATQDYKVYGVNASGRTEITASCALALDPSFGTFTNATATVLPHGGKTNVTATCGMQTGTALLAINLVGDVVVPPAPDNAGDQFGNATVGTDAARTPAIEYPLEHAVSPRNMPPIEAQWTAAGNALFHVSLTSSFVAINIYTTSLEALLSDADWESVLASSAGETLVFTVEGLSTAAPTRSSSARRARSRSRATPSIAPRSITGPRRAATSWSRRSARRRRTSSKMAARRATP